MNQRSGRARIYRESDIFLSKKKNPRNSQSEVLNLLPIFFPFFENVLWPRAPCEWDTTPPVTVVTTEQSQPGRWAHSLCTWNLKQPPDKYWQVPLHLNHCSNSFWRVASDSSLPPTPLGFKEDFRFELGCTFLVFTRCFCIVQRQNN